jgi:hypothetical protein
MYCYAVLRRHLRGRSPLGGFLKPICIPDAAPNTSTQTAVVTSATIDILSRICPIMSMAEYMPLTSTSSAEHDDEDFDSLKAANELPHQSNSLNVHNRRTTWITILMTIMAISAALAFHLTIVWGTSGSEPIRTPKDVTSSLRMLTPHPNLDKGRILIKQKKLKSEFPSMTSSFIYKFTTNLRKDQK